jgi:ADP-glucose pyrophosphorylase
VGSGCWIRPRATVRRSVLLPGAVVGEEACLEDCIVGPGYEVRPGEQIRGAALVHQTRARRRPSRAPSFPAYAGTLLVSA